ncbi:MAG: phenylacetate--CoA ligase family protein, partial [Actinobacteria bacterium]|nr:phenylacetate--CoA ligase family protein [Actinomycetota bacterium]
MSSIHKAWNLYKIMKSQWWQYEDLKELQDKKLRAIVKYAYENIPIYHEKFKDAGLMPEEIRTTKDLVKLPFLTKAEMQNNYPNRIVAPFIDIKRCWTPHTSGTTGMPLTILYDTNAEDFEKATALRPNLNCGQKLFDKWAVITCPDHMGNKKWFQRFGLFSQEQISLFEDTKKQISLLEKINPQILDGYSSSLYLIAKEIQASDNIKVRPKIIYGTSEMLTTKMRNFINSVFNVEIFDQFGCVEMGRTAWECPEHSGYHIDMEAVIMEFIKDNEQVESGERGEIVYTNLYNYAMPLIRYKIGDVGIPTDEKCPCGRGLPLMKILEGRKDAFVRTPDGRVFPPTIWIILLMHYNLEQFKVIQENINQINIQIVPGRRFNLENIPKMKSDV